MTLTNKNRAEIFTDGSCHTQYKIGGWAAIILINGEKVQLTGKENDTTHNQMELLAVIKAIEFVIEKYDFIDSIKVISDSQYVTGLILRKQKLTARGFNTKKGNEIKNSSLVIQLLRLTESIPIEFEKIKAHQKKTGIENYNIDADKLSRQIVRKAVKTFE